MVAPANVRKFLSLFFLFSSMVFVSHISATAKDWAISGIVLTPDQTIADGAVSISGTKIGAVGPSSSLPAGTVPTKIPGVILPGFIDLHNHLSWNALPRWTAAQKFANRYEWQNVPEYDRVLVAPHNAVLDAAGCEVEIYAEIKSLAGGATSSLGSLMGPATNPAQYRACAASLVRNLDLWSDLPFTPPKKKGDPCWSDTYTLLDVVDNEIFPMQVAHDKVDFLRCLLTSGALPGIVVHLSEGMPNDASAHQEFSMLQATGLMMPGLAIIHGTALRVADFQKMASSGTGLIWSPRSNDELYGATTNIPAAQLQPPPPPTGPPPPKLAIAIAPDWSPSGSAGMLQEMTYAARRYNTYFTAPQLLQMATSIPAKMVRLDGYIGSLAPDKYADLVAIRASGADPAKAVLSATPADILLVVVNGEALYGDPYLMAQLRPGDNLDSIWVCGAEKKVYLGQSDAVDLKKDLAGIEKDLREALQRSGSHLPAIECD